MPCPLCLEDKTAQQSHLTPKAIYRYFNTPDMSPIQASSSVVRPTDRQLTLPLLCWDCEQLLSSKGEEWLVPLLSPWDGRFPLYELLTSQRAEVVDGDMRLYAAVRNPSIDCDALVHFAMGVFWKAAAATWQTGTEARIHIELGPYAEKVRLFLSGRSCYPEDMALVVFIIPPPSKSISVMHPHEVERAGGVRNFTYVVPGVHFSLSVGKQIGEDVRGISITANGLRPIVAFDMSEVHRRKYLLVTRGAKKSKRLTDWLAANQLRIGRCSPDNSPVTAKITQETA